jgi:hypothetical protein
MDFYRWKVTTNVKKALRALQKQNNRLHLPLDSPAEIELQFIARVFKCCTLKRPKTTIILLKKYRVGIEIY